MRDNRYKQATGVRRVLKRATHEAGAESMGTDWDDRKRAVEFRHRVDLPKTIASAAYRVRVGERVDSD